MRPACTLPSASQNVCVLAPHVNRHFERYAPAPDAMNPLPPARSAATRLKHAGMAVAALAALLLAAAAYAQLVPPQAVQKLTARATPHALTQAAAIASAAPIPPPQSAPWQDVRLPDNWYRSRPGYSGAVWYRIPFEVRPDALFTHAIYVPRSSAAQLTFWVNAHRLSFSYAYGDPRLTELQRPLIYTVPAVMLHAGTNYLYIQAVGEADYRQGLTRVTIGHGARVRSQFYEPRFDAQITTTAILGSLLLLAGVLALLLWRADRKDPVLLWFGLTALASSVWSYQQLWPPDIAAVWLRDLTLFGLKYLYATPLLILCLRYGKRRSAKGEALLWSLYLAGCAAAAMLPPTAYPTLVTGAATLYIALFAVFFGWLCVRLFHGGHWRAYLLALALGAAVVVHGYDLARWLGYADFDNLLLTPYGTFFLILALGATVVDRHVVAIRRLDRSNRGLEREVAAKVQEVEHTYHAMERMLREQAVLRERQRIMADMHDGLGSSLVSMLALVQSGRVTGDELERRLTASVTELRAIVDSLEPVDGDLAAVLGNVRYRMRAALEQSGARVEWKVDDLPPIAHLTPGVILAIERILLEVLSNVLQHARARTITFSASLSNDGMGVVIRVADDGSGFDVTAKGNGRGLRSMTERARRAGLIVRLASSVGGGTVVTLIVPRHASVAPDAEAVA